MLRNKLILLILLALAVCAGCSSRVATKSAINGWDVLNRTDTTICLNLSEVEGVIRSTECYASFNDNDFGQNILFLDSDSSLRLLSYNYPDDTTDRLPISVRIYSRHQTDTALWSIGPLLNKNEDIGSMANLSGRRLIGLPNGYAIDSLLFVRLQEKDEWQRVFKMNMLYDAQIMTRKKAYLPLESYYFSDGPDRKIIVSFLSPELFSVTFKGETDDDFFYEIYEGSLQLIKAGEIGRLVYSSRSTHPNKNHLSAEHKDYVPPFTPNRSISVNNAFPVLGNGKFDCLHFTFGIPEYLRIGDFILQQVDNSTHPENGSWLLKEVKNEMDLPIHYRQRYQRMIETGGGAVFGVMRLPPDYK